jgi:hypothetical protein
MYLSRLTFHTLPGKTQEVEQKLMTLSQWVTEAGGLRPRVMRTHYGSLGAPDLVFEQEVPNPDALELQIKKVTENIRFQEWARQVAGLLEHSPPSESYTNLLSLTTNRVISAVTLHLDFCTEQCSHRKRRHRLTRRAAVVPLSQ